MGDLREGFFTAAFTHPILDSLGVYPPGVEVSVNAGEVAEARLVLPPMRSLLDGLCGDADREDGTAAMVGVVRDAGTGDPKAAVTVNLVWVDYRVEGSGDIFGDRMSIETSTNAQGRYRACGIPPGALVTIQAVDSGSVEASEEVVAPAETISRVDLTLGHPSAGESRASPLTCPSGESLSGGSGCRVRPNPGSDDGGSSRQPGGLAHLQGNRGILVCAGRW